MSLPTRNVQPYGGLRDAEGTSVPPGLACLPQPLPTFQAPLPMATACGCSGRMLLVCPHRADRLSAVRGTADSGGGVLP